VLQFLTHGKNWDIDRIQTGFPDNKFNMLAKNQSTPWMTKLLLVNSKLPCCLEYCR